MVLSQFSPHEGKKTLKDVFDVPPDVYPIGRLDYDSEGLLLLSNDNQLNHRLLNPAFGHEREYWAQVEGEVNNAALQKLQDGVIITVDGKNYRTKKCLASVFYPEELPERHPPIRYRKSIPTSWIRIILKEGKNRQVRKMTAAVGHPTLRLIRWRIEKINLDGMQPGDMREISHQQIYHLLF